MSWVWCWGIHIPTHEEGGVPTATTKVPLLTLDGWRRAPRRSPLIRETPPITCTCMWAGNGAWSRDTQTDSYSLFQLDPHKRKRQFMSYRQLFRTSLGLITYLYIVCSQSKIVVQKLKSGQTYFLKSLGLSIIFFPFPWYNKSSWLHQNDANNGWLKVSGGPHNVHTHTHTHTLW